MKQPKPVIEWPAFVAFLFVWAAATIICLDEELGIAHKFGLQPITIDSLNNPVLFGAILLAGPTFTAWWAVHVYRRKYGDIAKKWAAQKWYAWYK